MNQGDFDANLLQLAEERRRLQALRTDYEVILKSRFHALRLFWLSLKALLGLTSQRDRYAAWTPGLAAPLVSLRPVVVRGVDHSETPGSIVARPDGGSQQEQHLIASWNARSSSHPLSLEPIVSVVIPVFNHVDTTIRCLQSIADTWSEHLRMQIIIVDDGSTDETPSIAAKLPGVDYVRGSNRGFVRACNRGAALSLGKYVCFLNNDTIARDGWLDYLVIAAESDTSIGAVGAKLIYPDGKLQEAGGIIWRDASGHNYGRNGNPEDPQYNYRRDVDYCSGAALMVRRDILERLGGFSEEFVPAYYEDADLCFGVRSLGFRVVYQPRAEIVHDEGTTSGTDLAAGAKQYQEINRPRFARKWAAELQAHFDNDQQKVEIGARRLARQKSILVVDSYVPMYDRDAGSSRLMRVIRMLREANYHVIFLPDNFAPLQPYTRELQDLGVEVLHHIENGRPMADVLKASLPLVDLAWVCRPDLFAKYEPLIRENPAIRVLYDTIDLHFVRARREAEVLGTGSSAWQEIERTELSAAAKADATVVVTEFERDTLKERGITNVFVVPTLHDIELKGVRNFDETSGLLFIGGYNHPPNGDAVKWLIEEIMPVVWRRDPSIKVTLLGSNPPDSVTRLQTERVRVPGYVRDVAPYFLKSRLFVAPLRYGAGMNGKVGHALAYGLPVITTIRGAEGFNLRNERDCLIANDAPSFAEAILRAYGDSGLWADLSRASLKAIAPFQSQAVAPKLLAMLATIARLPDRVTERA